MTRKRAIVAAITSGMQGVNPGRFDPHMIAERAYELGRIDGLREAATRCFKRVYFAERTKWLADDLTSQANALAKKARRKNGE